MNELLQKVRDISVDVVQFAGFAAAGACFAFSAGGHEVYAEQATTAVARHHQEDLRNDNLIPAVIFEGLVVAKGIATIRRKTRTS